MNRMINDEQMIKTLKKEKRKLPTAGFFFISNYSIVYFYCIQYIKRPYIFFVESVRKMGHLYWLQEIFLIFFLLYIPYKNWHQNEESKFISFSQHSLCQFFFLSLIARCDAKTCASKHTTVGLFISLNFLHISYLYTVISGLTTLFKTTFWIILAHWAAHRSHQNHNNNKQIRVNR